ncbi:MAG TPA: hypothetical protein VFE61_00510 [Candidatus Sulfotelmatobacter sp.]|nr:hypothetical protein [Candidatus Sulfotelmatobacter sp.]
MLFKRCHQPRSLISDSISCDGHSGVPRKILATICVEAADPRRGTMAQEINDGVSYLMAVKRSVVPENVPEKASEASGAAAAAPAREATARRRWHARRVPRRGEAPQLPLHV